MISICLCRESYAKYGPSPPCWLFFIFLNLLFKTVMIPVGHYDRDDCPNGAANWLFVAGIVLLVSNVIIGSAQLIKVVAIRRRVASDKLLMAVHLTIGVMLALELAFIIWGSVVVFGVWHVWLNSYYDILRKDYRMLDIEEDSKKSYYNDEDFCKYNGMMCAFVFLICHWVIIILWILFLCFIVLCPICLTYLKKEEDGSFNDLLR